MLIVCVHLLISSLIVRIIHIGHYKKNELHDRNEPLMYGNQKKITPFRSMSAISSEPNKSRDVIEFQSQLSLKDKEL